MRMTSSEGFSLIELMIVITIISILSAIAVPSYQFYIKRARFAEIIAATEIFKTAVTLALEEGQSLNDLSTGTHGIPPEPAASKNLQSLTVTSGVITATATDLLDDATYILTPDNNGETWAVSGSCLQSGLCSAG